MYDGQQRQNFHHDGAMKATVDIIRGGAESQKKVKQRWEGLWGAPVENRRGQRLLFKTWICLCIGTSCTYRRGTSINILGLTCFWVPRENKAML